MSTDLARTSETFPNPVTGEVLTLESPSEDLARFLDDFKDYYLTVRRAVNAELVHRLDRQAKWTEHLPGVTISCASPEPTEDWDGGTLREALLPLVDRGVISIEALDAAVETCVEYKPRKRGITALRKLGGETREIIDSLRREKPKGERWVRVERPLRP